MKSTAFTERHIKIGSLSEQRRILEVVGLFCSQGYGGTTVGVFDRIDNATQLLVDGLPVRIRSDCCSRPASARR